MMAFGGECSAKVWLWGAAIYLHFPRTQKGGRRELGWLDDGIRTAAVVKEMNDDRFVQASLLPPYFMACS